MKTRDRNYGVSVSKILYRRLRAHAEATGQSMQQVVEREIHRAINREERLGGPAKIRR